MMFDHPLYETILRDPDDDQTRLVVADWLEEQGDVRGEFIRVQIAIARAHAEGRKPDRGLKDREEQLQKEHCDQWGQELFDRVKDLARVARGRAEGLVKHHLFYRGFPSWLGTSSAVLKTYGDTLMQAAPWQYLRVDCGDGKLTDLVDWAGLANIRTLTLRHTRGYRLEPLSELLRSERLHGLELLKIDYPGQEIVPRWRELIFDVLGDGGLAGLQECNISNERLIPVLQ